MILKECKVGDKIRLMNGETDPAYMFFQVCEEDINHIVKGYVSCKNLSNGIKSHINGDLLCVIEEPPQN